MISYYYFSDYPVQWDFNLYLTLSFSVNNYHDYPLSLFIIIPILLSFDIIYQFYLLLVIIIYYNYNKFGALCHKYICHLRSKNFWKRRYRTIYSTSCIIIMCVTVSMSRCPQPQQTRVAVQMLI